MPKLTLKLPVTSNHRSKAASPRRTKLKPNSAASPPSSSPNRSKTWSVALRLAQAANRRVFVRSGRSISAADVTKPTATPRAACRRAQTGRRDH